MFKTTGAGFFLPAQMPVLLLVLHGGSAAGRWVCDLQVAGSIPGRWLSRNIGQLSLASLRGR